MDDISDEATQQDICKEFGGYVTIEHAASLLQCAHTTLYDAIKGGRLQTVCVLGSHVLRKNDALNYPLRVNRRREEKKPLPVSAGAE